MEAEVETEVTVDYTDILSSMYRLDIRDLQIISPIKLIPSIKTIHISTALSRDTCTHQRHTHTHLAETHTLPAETDTHMTLGRHTLYTHTHTQFPVQFPAVTNTHDPQQRHTHDFQQRHTHDSQ